jgi:hypothetical protein
MQRRRRLRLVGRASHQPDRTDGGRRSAEDASTGGRAGAVEQPEAAGDDAEPAPGALDGQALATTAGVVVATSDIRAAVADTLATVQRNNATVFNADVDIGSRTRRRQHRRVRLVRRQGAAGRSRTADRRPRRHGRHRVGRTQETSDVTDQLVDLDIRIGVERDVIDRFRLLLDEATEFQDIVDIERVIAERTIALEQLLASQRNLENRVELSTLTIELQYATARRRGRRRRGRPDDTIGDAWRAGWDAFVGVLFALGFVLAVAAPFLTDGLVAASSARHSCGWRSADARRTPGVPAASAAPSRSRSVTPDGQLAGPTPGG